MLDIYKDFYNNIVKRNLFWLPVLLTGVCAYGFSIMNRTIGIDDLQRDYYVNTDNAMVGAGRWGQWLYVKLFGASELAPFYDRFLALVFLIIASVTFCAVLYYVTDSRDVLPYTLTACEYISFPLFTELWEFGGVNWMVGINMTIANLVILDLLILYRSQTRTRLWRHILLTGIAMSLVFSSYESGVFYYFAVALIVSYLMILHGEGDFQSHARQILFLLTCFVPALILRIIVGMGLKWILQPTATEAGNIALHWGENSVIGVLITTAWNYFAKCLIFLPITIFVGAFFLFIGYTIIKSVRGHNPLLMLIGLGVLISLFAQEIIQCAVMPYRTAQTLTVFVAFVVWLFVVLFEGQDKRKYAAYLVIGWLCLMQCAYCNRVLSINNLRSENELNALSQVGYEILHQYGEDVPVLVVGETVNTEYVDDMLFMDISKGPGKLFAQVYNLLRGDNYDPNYHRIGEFLAVSNIENSFRNEHTITAYFSLSGYDLNVIERNTEEGERVYEEADEIAKDMHKYEIREWNGYVIAKF